MITVVPFVLLWVLMWAVLDAGYSIGLVLSVPAAGFLVRLFMIQHDCGHGSFFRRRSMNDWVGRVIGALTLTPYDFWRRSHALHHAGSGNLDHRGIGDIDTLTVREYLTLPRWRPTSLSHVSAPGRDVRRAAGLSVHFAPPTADGAHAQWLAALGERHGNERCDRDPGRSDHLAGRRRSIPARAFADYASRSVARRLVVLRPAPVRGYPGEYDDDWTFQEAAAARQFAL